MTSNQHKGYFLAGSVAIILIFTVVGFSINPNLKHNSALKPKATSGACYACQAQGTSTLAISNPECVDQYVIIQAGSAIKITGDQALDPGTDQNPAWNTNRGIVKADGTYVAPANVFADGIDIISYTDPATGVISQIGVLVIPNSGASIDPQAPMLTEVEPSTISSLPSLTPDGGTISAISAINEEIPVNILHSSISQVPISTPIPLVPTIVGGETLYAVPQIGGNVQALYLSVAPGDPAPLVACRKALFPPPVGPCNGGTTEVVGPDHLLKNYGIFDFSVKIDGKIKTDLQKFGIDVSVGATIPASFVKTTYRWWHDVDYYRCVNGVWQYNGSKQCSAYGTQQSNFIPTWTAKIPYGTTDPSPITWTPVTCTNI